MAPQDTASTHLSGLAKRLVRDEILSENQAIEEYQYSKQNRIPFVTTLVPSGLTRNLGPGHAAIPSSHPSKPCRPHLK